MGRHFIGFTVLWAGIALPTIAVAGSIPYGLTFADSGSVSYGAQGQNAFGKNIQNQQLTSASDSFSLNLNGATSILDASISGSQMHLYSQTIAGPVATCCLVSASADLAWFDTFTFQPGAYDVMLDLKGTLDYQVLNGVDVGSFADVLKFFVNDSLQAQIFGATNPDGASVTVHLSFNSPTEVVLTESLTYRSAIRNIGVGVTQESITADYSHTADFFVTPTNGGSYATASGLSYSSTPEPSTFLLLAGGACCCTGSRRILRRSGRRV